MSDAKRLNRDELDAIITRAPFHQWLGLGIESVTDDEIVVTAKWREEFVVNAEGGYTHGGILATLIDVCADYALAADLGRAVPTVDLRIDYHRAAMKGDLRIRAKVVRMGGTFATAEAYVYDMSDKLLASGRGVYFSGAARKG